MSPTSSTEALIPAPPPAREKTSIEPPRPEWSPSPRPSKPRRARWKLLAIPFAAILVITMTFVAVKGWVASGPTDNIQLYKVARRSFPITVQEKGELKAAHITDVRCELEGKSTIIYLVPEGYHVQKGELLVELASDEIDEKIRDAEIKVATAKAAFEAAEKELQILRDQNLSDISKAKLALWVAQKTLESYVKGESAQLQQTDELALEKAKYVLKRTEETLKDSEELHAKGFITRIELENDRFEYVQAKMELAKAETALKVTKEYTIPIAIQEKRSAVEEAEKELARTERSAQAAEDKAVADVAAKRSEYELNADKLKKLHEQKAKSRILAPADGLVVYFREEWDEAPRIQIGAQVVERQRLIELPDTSSMKVSLRIHEAKVEQIKIGQPATVQIEGFTGRQFTGKVSKIAVLAEARHWFNRNLKEYETEVLLDGTFKDLKPGTTARAEILVAQLKNVLAVPVQAVFAKDNRYFVFVDENGEARPVEVKVGLSSVAFVEIKEGIKEGDQIRLNIDEEMKLKLPQSRSRGEGSESGESDGRPGQSSPSSRPAIKDQATSRPAGRSKVNDIPASRPAL